MMNQIKRSPCPPNHPPLCILLPRHNLIPVRSFKEAQSYLPAPGSKQLRSQLAAQALRDFRR